MRRFVITMIATALAACTPSGDRVHHEQATPLEVISKVREAALLLAAQGAAGMEVLRDSTSEFTWKNSYVFVVDCDADLVLANPAFPERQGGDIKQHLYYNGKQYGLELCETAKQPEGGWVEYVWPKPGGGEPSRKISYVITADSLSYQVGAGIYDETISLSALKQITEANQ